MLNAKPGLHTEQRREYEQYFLSDQASLITSGFLQDMINGHLDDKDGLCANREEGRVYPESSRMFTLIKVILFHAMSQTDQAKG